MNSYLFADDLSFNAVATQSKTPNDPSNLYAANYAVDRNPTTCMRTDDIGHTATDKPQLHSTWWKVDFGGTFNIYSINILFKKYINFGMYKFDSIQFESCYCTQAEQYCSVQCMNSSYRVVRCLYDV